MVGNLYSAGQEGGSHSLLRTAPADGLPERILDPVLAEQRRDWIAGKRIPADETLRQHPELADETESAAELIYHEFSLRNELGESPDWQEYLRQFPGHAAALQMLRRADEIFEQAIPSPVPSLPEVEFDDYELLGEIGRGGMGVVYKARQKSLDRIVALKMIRMGEDAGEAERKRFHGEARAVARLHHPNIAQIYEVGEVNGRLFLTLEYVEGKSLASWLNGIPWPARRAARLVETTARAMDYAHGKQIIHRDLKPANILLASDGEANGEWSEHPLPCTPKITDFGLAKRLDATAHSQSEAVLGTPSYMAPEQAQVKPGIDARTDVYGLGAVLYELLTGRPPFRADSALQTLRQVVDAEPIRPHLLNPSVPRDLETVCLKCLEKEPSRRYATALALADDLERFENGQPVLARPIGALARGWRWWRRNPIPAGLAALLVLVLIAGLSGILYQWRQTDAARREAVAKAAESRSVLSELIQSSAFTPLTDEFPQPPSIEPLLKAAEHCRELLQNDPEDTELRIALTNVYGRLGSRYYSLGQSAEESSAFLRAVQLWESPSPRVAAHPDFRYWLATTRYWRGTLALRQEETALGYQWLLSAEEIWEQLGEEQPDNLDILAKATSCCYDLQRITDSSSLAEVCRPSLEALKTRLEQQFQGSSSNPALPPNRVLRKRLALICQMLGNARSQTRSAKLARESWQQAADLYTTLGTNGSQPDTAEDALLLILGGDAYRRLAGVSPSDLYYARAVAAFERAGKLLDTRREQIPDGDWLSEMLPHVYCTLAGCHAKAGRPDLAEKTYQDHVRPLVAHLEAKRTDPRHALGAESGMCHLVHALSDAGLRPAALAVARRAAKFTTDFAAFPLHYPELDFSVAVCAWELARGFRDLGDAAAALQQADHARRLWADYCQARPNAHTGGIQLAHAWVEVGKAQLALGRSDEAWTAFQEAVSVQRRVLDRSPEVEYLRIYLDGCYDLLLDCGIRRGDWSGSAAALHEREKLWNNDSDRLMGLSLDFKKLADAMARGSKQLSAEEEAARQHYLAESERIRQAAEATARRQKLRLKADG
jgi:tetratricopeptide (TPR) repeat protein/tRNA A-37 threonylcarbamoyl transferase component Bud32